MKIVTDTSVILAVLLGESHRDRLVEMTQGADLIAPPSLHWEIGNALSAMFKRDRVSLQTARECLSEYDIIPIQSVDVDLVAAVELTHSEGIYAYDAYMLEVARSHRAPLLTLDEELQTAARRRNIRILEVEP